MEREEPASEDTARAHGILTSAVKTSQLVTPKPPSAARIAALVVALLCALVASTGASASPPPPPCADAILAEWLDTNEVENVYPLQCYQAAIDAIPQDLEDYTNAADVIARAFQRAAGRRLERTPQGPVEPPSEPTASPAVDTSSSTSVPIPLLVLGGMSLALLVSGGVGYVSRRRRDGHEPL
jgi:hypothetical protein